MKTIKLVDLPGQFGPLKEEILDAVSKTLDGMNLYLGENVYELERDFARFCHTKYAVGVGSGTDGLHLALRAFEIGSGDEVITAANSFFATAEAIALTGARPVLVDIDPLTYTMDPHLIEAAITPRTRAVIPVHLYGHPADMTPILDIARRHHLIVIEDACQAHGAEYGGQRAGSLGHVGIFSFYCSKNLGAYGEGGMVVTDDRDIATRLQMLRNHGSSERYLHTYMGMNSRLDELQAAILRVKLPYLEQWNTKRRSLALEYTQRLRDVRGVVTPVELPNSRHVFHLYVIRVPRRDEIRQGLDKLGIQTGIHYPVPIHLQVACTGLGYREGDFPHSEAASRDILSLPMHPELTIDEVAYVTQTLKDGLLGRRARRATAQAAQAMVKEGIQ